MRAEVGDLLLMQAKEALDVPHAQHRQMCKRAESTIPHQEVRRTQQGMEHPDFRGFVGKQGKAERVDHQAGDGIREQAQGSWAPESRSRAFDSRESRRPWPTPARPA